MRMGRGGDTMLLLAPLPSLLLLLLLLPSLLYSLPLSLLLPLSAYVGFHNAGI
jgi:hypothetical protein